MITKEQIEDENYGLYSVEDKWLFECRPGMTNFIFYLMQPSKCTPEIKDYYAVGVSIPNTASDELILKKVTLAKQNFDKYKHLVDLDGGDLGIANI